MVVASYLLLFMGVLGATDILLYHTLAHGIRGHADSRAELFTHFLRGPVYAALFLLVPNFGFHGAAFTGLIALLAADLGVSLADFWLETRSRKALGGLPRGEYVLHVILAMLFGALVCSVLYENCGAIEAETAMRWRSEAAHPIIRVVLAVMAPAVLWSGILDLRAMMKLGGSDR